MSAASKLMKITKRAFLFGGLAVGGGMVVGYAVLRERPGTAGFGAFGQAGAALNAWVKITPDGQVVIAVPRAEMGQGVQTGLAMLVAEELEVDLDTVSIEHPDLDGKYANAFIMTEGLPQFAPLIWLVERVTAFLPLIATGGSTSIRDGWENMRRVGASARAMLVEAAAERWGVEASECVARSGRVVNRISGESLTYGALARAAALQPPPKTPALKPVSEFRLIGRPTPRLDVPAKVTGEAVFGIDVRLPGLLFAAVRHCPYRGGSVVSYQAEAVMNRPGVEAVVPVKNGVAVVARSFWTAKKAVEDLPITFDDGGHGDLSSDGISRLYHEALEKGDVIEVQKEGDVQEALQSAARVHEAVYELPYLAHTCMEPMNCTVRVQGEEAEVWVGSQVPTLVNWGVAEAAGVDHDKVKTHITFLGGGFGRRSERGIVEEAALIARAVEGRPVQLIWTREEDVQHDSYRPAVVARLRGGLDLGGRLVAWTHRLVLQSVEASYGRRNTPQIAGDGTSDSSMTQGAVDLPYELPNVTVDKVVMDVPVEVGFWRSVGHSHNGFFVESFIDEMAAVSQEDPYAFRRGLLADAPRHRAVLDLVADKAGWGAPLGAGRGRGIALHQSFGSIVAQVVEVSITSDGDLAIDRVICSVDCGLAVNPDSVKAQMESGIVYGLSAALYGEITLEGGQVMQSNFPDYDAVRLAEMPVIETYIVDSTAAPGGIGEPGTPPIAPALTNAIFAATGRRIRRLPLNRLDFLSV